MKNKYFETQDSLYDITKKYKVAIDLLVSAGFENIKDENSQKNLWQSNFSRECLKIKKYKM